MEKRIFRNQRPPPVVVRLKNEWAVRNSLPNSNNLRSSNFNSIFVSRSSSTSDQAQLRKLPKLKFELACAKTIPKSRLNLHNYSIKGKTFHDRKKHINLIGIYAPNLDARTNQTDWYWTITAQLNKVQSLISNHQRFTLLNSVLCHQLAVVFLCETWLTSGIDNIEVFAITDLSVLTESDKKTGSHVGLIVACENSSKQLTTDNYFYGSGASFIKLHYRLTPLFFFKLCFTLPKTPSYSINGNMLCEFNNEKLTLALAKGKQNDTGIEKCNVFCVCDFSYPYIDWDNLSLNLDHKRSFEGFDEVKLHQLVATTTQFKGNILNIYVTSNSNQLKMFFLDNPFFDLYTVNTTSFVEIF